MIYFLGNISILIEAPYLMSVTTDKQSEMTTVNYSLCYPLISFYCKETPQELFARLKDLTNESKLISFDDPVCPKIFSLDPDVYHQIDKLTDLYSESVRIHACLNGCISPIKYWKIHGKRLRDLCMKQHGKVDYFLLSELCYKEMKCATLFKCSLSKLIYDYHSLDGIVLDPFSGWGDRLLGALASSKVKKYIGIDCNPKLEQVYKNIQKDLDTTNKSEMYNCRFEDFMRGKGSDYSKSIDLIFTSPPFFDFEIYTDLKDDKQSYHRKYHYQQWVNEWYKPTLASFSKLLKNGGKVILYVGETWRTPTLPEDTNKIMIDLGYKQDCVLKRINGKQSISTFYYTLK